MLTVLGILVLLVLPSVIGVLHDKRVDRQIRAAQRRYFTSTVTRHS